MMPLNWLNHTQGAKRKAFCPKLSHAALRDAKHSIAIFLFQSDNADKGRKVALHPLEKAHDPVSTQNLSAGCRQSSNYSTRPAQVKHTLNNKEFSSR